MAISSGKSSSLAAVLLLLAVLAGTCASGAEAKFNITSLCNKTITITTSTGNFSLGEGGVLNITQLPDLFFVGNVTITVTGTNPPIKIVIPVPQILLDIINLLGVTLQKIVITCVGNCIIFTVTYELPFLPPITIPFGPFCPII